MQKATIDDRDWSALTLGERIRHVELEGYLVIPDLLSPEHTRSVLAIAYRPSWAGPIAEVENWDEEDLAGLPESVRPFFTDPNTRHWDFDVPNKPNNMASEAPGVNPSRWQRA